MCGPARRPLTFFPWRDGRRCSPRATPRSYFEGAQHNKLKSQYRVASFDTSVFWLQSSKARERWPVTDAKVARLKEAFRPKQKEDPSGSGGALAEGGGEGGRPAKRARAAAAGAAPR